MKINRLAVVTLSLAAFAACDGSSSTSVAETADALESAQSEFCTFRAEADACRAAFDACLAVEGADAEACRSALHDCLPPPPERAAGGHCGGDGGERPARGDGGVPPGGRGGPGHHGGRGGRGGIVGVQPDQAAVTACRDALAACLAATPGDQSCKETERTCVREAFRAAFDAACADAANVCTTIPEDACTRLTARCAEGIDGRVDTDGGVCAAAPAVIP